MTRPRPTRPRKPGRPLAENADHRERLLDAALALFAEVGIANVALRRIADAAGVTPALVTYYFGNKEQLVASVIEERVLPAFVQGLGAVALSPPEALVPNFVASISATVARHPWLPGLWVREILTEGGALRELMLDRIAPALPRALAQRFAEQQRLGTLNTDLDPRLLVVSMIGLTLFVHAAQPVWSRIFDASDITAEQLQRHTLALLARGLGTAP